jgi:hypothetical protein
VERLLATQPTLINATNTRGIMSDI